jgi:hypothetical protein
MTEALTTAQRLRVLALTGPGEIVVTMTPEQALQMAAKLEAAEQIDQEKALLATSSALREEAIDTIQARLADARWRMDEIEQQLLTRFWWWALALVVGWAVMLA